MGFELFYRRGQGSEAKIKIPKAMELAFEKPTTDGEREVKALIDAFNAQETTRVEQELFAQRKRLADAERTLAIKTTAAATNSKRIATDKILKAIPSSATSSARNRSRMALEFSLVCTHLS